MADTTKRLHYFNGQFLEEKDFTDEQEYHLDRGRRHNRLLHTYGIAEGLNVTGAAGAGDVTVSPGTALDGQGRLIVLEQSRTLTLASFSKETVYVVISYDEIGVDPATVGNQGQPTRWEERPKVELVTSATAPPADTHIRLAKVTVNSGGTVSTLDLSERQLAGVRVGGELSIPRLRLSNPNFDESLWPNVTSENQQEVTVTGDLRISGRLYSDDLAAHVKDSGNPHGVTAGQTGAPVSVAGVSNPGGNINIVAGTGISVSPDNSGNKRITISGSSVQGVSNPGGDIGITGTNGINVTSDNSSNKRITIAGGSPTNIGGVTNAGGTVNIVGGGIVTVSPDNSSNKRLTISAPAALSNRFVSNAVFTTADANGATRTINVGFQPRFIWFIGHALGGIGGFIHGGPINGFVDLETNPFTQVCNGPNFSRQASPTVIVVNTHLVNNACARATFADTTVSPNLQLDMTVTVSGVSASGFTLTYNRTSNANFPISFSLSLYMVSMA